MPRPGCGGETNPDYVVQPYAHWPDTKAGWICERVWLFGGFVGIVGLFVGIAAWLYAGMGGLGNLEWLGWFKGWATGSMTAWIGFGAVLMGCFSFVYWIFAYSLASLCELAGCRGLKEKIRCIRTDDA